MPSRVRQNKAERKPSRAKSRRRSGLRRAVVWSLRLAAVGLGGWLAYEAWRFPDVGTLARSAPERTSFMAWRAREAAAAGRPYRVTRTWLPLARMSPHLRAAVIAAEDDRFYAHEGFDGEEIRDAIEDHFVLGKRLRGASTISQQLAKNLWLDPRRNPLRKAREVVYTWALERRIGKDRILELYLNLIEWGPGVYGAEAAARRYFATSAADLDPRQAALLAAAIPSPLKRDPGHPSRALARRADRLLARMGVRVEDIAAMRAAAEDPGDAPVSPRAASSPEAAAVDPAGPGRAPVVAVREPRASATPSPSPSAETTTTAARATPARAASASPARATKHPSPVDLLRPPATPTPRRAR